MVAKKLLAIIVTTSLFALSAQADEAAQNKVEELLTIETTNHSEGDQKTHNDFNCLIKRTNYLTYPGDIKIVETEGMDGASKGAFKYKFKCRVRVKRYACGGILESVDDHQRPGSIEGRYLYVFGDLAIEDIDRVGGEGRCGNFIKEHLKKASEDN